MKKFRHILASTDLSPESFSAVQYAAHLAKAQAAKLTILHVPQTTTLMFTDFSPPVDLLSLDREIEAAALETLQGWVKRHLRNQDGVKLVVKPGVTHEVINEVAADVDASVIVMATHGRSGIGRAILGSVTDRVLREAPCPVLVVRPPDADEGRRGRGRKK